MEHSGHPGLGDAVAIADLLGGFAGFVAVHDIGDILRSQEALEAGFGDILGQLGWSARRFVDASAQVNPLFTEVTEVRVSSYCLHFSDT
jgi:hypothetical protein